MIDVHQVLVRKRNTAYAFEGLAHAYKVAASRNDVERQEKFHRIIDLGLSKLLSWQVGHPLANSFIRGFTPQPQDLGGVQGVADDGLLRIDAIQHLLHALLLCRKYVYR